MNRHCSICQKPFKYRQSLWRHKKTCKGNGKHAGSGLLYSTNTIRPQVNRAGETSDDLVRDRETLDSTEMESGFTGHDHCADDAMDASSTAESESVEGTSSDEESINEDFNLWEQFVQFTIEMKGESTIFDTLCYFLSPYFLRLEDDTCNEIMNDVEEGLQYQDMSYADALDYAVEKNIDLIMISIDNALKDGCGDDNSFTIWCALAVAVENKNKEYRSLSYYDKCC